MTQFVSDTAAPPDDRRPVQVGFRALTLGSIGVVYGDIGTSPLYAFREAVVAAADSGPITREIVLGVLSLILWVDLKQRQSMICEPKAMPGEVAAARSGGHYGGRSRPSAEAYQAVAR
jgi:hypothetical protein